jgi:hypothetical protein
MHLRTYGSFKSANHKNDWFRKSQVLNVPYLRKIRKSNKFADLRFLELICRPPSLVNNYFNSTHYIKLINSARQMLHTVGYILAAGLKGTVS